METVLRENEHGIPQPGKLRDVIILIAAASCVWLAFVSVLPVSNYPLFSDYWDCLQIGRQIAHGHGFTSLFTYPAFLGLTKDGNAAFPVLWRGPMYPLLIAGLYSAIGPNPHALLGVCGLFFVLTVLLTYLLGRVFFSRGASLVASFLFMLSTQTLNLNSIGYPEIILAFFFVLSTLLLSGTATVRRFLLAGLAFAMGILTQFSLLVFLPVLGIYGFYRAQRETRNKALTAFLSLPAITSLLLQIRNWSITGNPFFSTGKFHMIIYPVLPRWTIARSVESPVSLSPGFLLSNTFTVLSQCVLNLQRYIWTFPGLLGALGLSFFLLAFFLKWPKNGMRTFVKLVFLALAVGILAIIPFDFDTGLLVPIFPLSFILTAGTCFVLLKKLGREVFFLRNTLAVVVSIMILGQLRTLSLEVRHAGTKLARPSLESDMETIRKISPADGLVISDIPDFVSWNTERTGLWLPDFDQLQKTLSMTDVDAIYLSPQYGTVLSTPGDSWWNRVAAGTRTIPGFQTRQKLPDGGILLVRSR